MRELDIAGGPPGIVEFKRRLGAHKVTYLDVECTHSHYTPFFDAWAVLKARFPRY